jgi:hypothetical protein
MLGTRQPESVFTEEGSSSHISPMETATDHDDDALEQGGLVERSCRGLVAGNSDPTERENRGLLGVGREAQLLQAVAVGRSRSPTGHRW